MHACINCNMGMRHLPDSGRPEGVHTVSWTSQIVLMLQLLCNTSSILKIYCRIQSFLTAIQCPPGMVFRQCGSLCQQTCGSSTTCNSGCAEGCFCPDGQVINSNGLRTNPRECLGKRWVHDIAIV